jgi:hypothetical protein
MKRMVVMVELELNEAKLPEYLLKRYVRTPVA